MGGRAGGGRDDGHRFEQFAALLVAERRNRDATTATTTAAAMAAAAAVAAAAGTETEMTDHNHTHSLTRSLTRPRIPFDLPLGNFGLAAFGGHSSTRPTLPPSMHPSGEPENESFPGEVMHISGPTNGQKQCRCGASKYYKKRLLLKILRLAE